MFHTLRKINIWKHIKQVLPLVLVKGTSLRCPLNPLVVKIGPGNPRRKRKKASHEDPKRPGKLSMHGRQMGCKTSHELLKKGRETYLASIKQRLPMKKCNQDTKDTKGGGANRGPSRGLIEELEEDLGEAEAEVQEWEHPKG